MTSREALRNTIEMSDMVINSYISDLSDDDLKITPMPGINPIGWQLGHLIHSDRQFVEMIAPGSCPALPADFEAAHPRKAAEADASKFYSRERYQELWKAQRDATLAVLEKQSDDDLSRTDASFPRFAPNVGAILNMCGLHSLMHAGQFVAVRRLTGKPVLI